MRIWLVSQNASLENIPGITRHYELASEWSRDPGVQVTLWLTTFIHSLRRFISKDELRESKQNVAFKLKWLWSFPHKKNDFRRVINMLSFSLNLFWKGLFSSRPDIIIGSSPPLFVPWVCWLLARVKKCQFVLEIRDLWPDSLSEMGGIKNKYILAMLKKLELFLYQKADKIIVVTQYQADFIHNLGIARDQIELIPNGVLLSSWQPPDESERQKYRLKLGLKPDEFVAIYTGAHGPANGLEAVVQAGKYLPVGMKILLAGDGPEKTNLIALRDRLGLDNILFVEAVPKNQILNYTFAANCGIISLLNNEIFRGARPNKLFDYTFVGLPIISNVDGEIHDIISDYELGVFAGVQDARGLAEAMIRVSRFSPQKLLGIKHNGHNYISRYGDRSKLAAKFLQLLRWLKNKKVSF